MENFKAWEIFKDKGKISWREIKVESCLWKNNYWLVKNYGSANNYRLINKKLMDKKLLNRKNYEMRNKMLINKYLWIKKKISVA